MNDLFANQVVDAGPVECLGQTFPSEQARRAHFLAILAERLKDPEFRKIEGFPIGTDADLLAMSDPPYYTACPNPFLEQFVAHDGRPYDPEVAYRREPLTIDVSVGKTDPLYKAHGYHTKVPHLAIVPSILHYTEPGDLVLDGFAGSGMTGVAAQWCGAAPAAYRHQLEGEWKHQGKAPPRWGARRVILNDLSPAATFIAANYNLPFDVGAFAAAGRQLLKELEQELGWMYETLHTDGKTQGRIEYTVWSEVFACPECAGQLDFIAEALDAQTKRVRDRFPCPHCGADLNKERLERVLESRIDPATGEPWQRVKFRPALISYVAQGQRREKRPDAQDLAVLERIGALPLPPQIGAAKKKGEIIPELGQLLDDSFLCYEGAGEVPSQIHAYLSTNHQDLRDLARDHPALVAKAQDRWYVPDPNKAQDLEKKREKALLKEFATYQAHTGRRLKEFRLEVLRAGFKAAWATKDYRAIVALAAKIPDEALQEDEKLLLWYDQALTRMESGL